VFLGSYEPSFDKSSRRIALPKKIRDVLTNSEIILSFGFEKCIFGFDTQAWENESGKQLVEPLTSANARSLRRFFFSAAESVKLDDQGRFVIPGNLLAYAKIEKPVIIGAGDHFEIWDGAVWQKHLGQIQKQAK